MDSQEKYTYWLDIAQYDLDVAESMCKSSHWLYVVFMCQQAIEKLVKGLYTVYVDDNVPRIHNIKPLIEKFDDKLPKTIPEEIFEFFNTLSSYYLNNRYPDFISKLSEQINETEAKGVLLRTKEVFIWLSTLKA